MGWWSPWSSGSQSDPEGRSDDSRRSKDESARSLWHSPTPSSTTSTSSQYTEWNSILNSFNWSQLKEPGNLVPTILLTGGLLFVFDIHRRFLRRIPEATNISPSILRRRSLLGRVTSVGDGDNFRMYHTPGGRLAGWGWLPWKKVPTLRKELKDRTVCFTLFYIHTYNTSAKTDRGKNDRFTFVSQESMLPNFLISVDRLNHSHTRHTPG
jgi:hypothetical protein